VIALVRSIGAIDLLTEHDARAGTVVAVAWLIPRAGEPYRMVAVDDDHRGQLTQPCCPRSLGVGAPARQPTQAHILPRRRIASMRPPRIAHICAHFLPDAVGSPNHRVEDGEIAGLSCG
jgi:hypothetical protein